MHAPAALRSLSVWVRAQPSIPIVAGCELGQNGGEPVRIRAEARTCRDEVQEEQEDRHPNLLLEGGRPGRIAWVKKISPMESSRVSQIPTLAYFRSRDNPPCPRRCCGFRGLLSRRDTEH